MPYILINKRTKAKRWVKMLRSPVVGGVLGREGGNSSCSRGRPLDGHGLLGGGHLLGDGGLGLLGGVHGGDLLGKSGLKLGSALLLGQGGFELVALPLVGQSVLELKSLALLGKGGLPLSLLLGLDQMGLVFSALLLLHQGCGGSLHGQGVAAKRVAAKGAGAEGSLVGTPQLPRVGAPSAAA